MLSKALSVAAAKAKVTGLVVAAAAIGGTAVSVGSMAFVPTAGDTTVTASPSPSDSPAAPVTPTPTDSPSPDPTASSAAPVASPSCPAGVKNHGAYVSSVAHDKTLKGRAHGQAVSAAATSSCGKTGADASSSTDATESPDPAESPEPTDSPDVSGSSAKHRHGHH